MNLQMEITTLNGQLKREPDSRYAVSLWYVPGGCDYVNARVIVGFWSEDDEVNARAFHEKYNCHETMADFCDLHDEKRKTMFKPKLCVSCGQTVNYNYGSQMWVSDAQQELGQYCWVDFVKGSQLHKVSPESN